MADVETSARLMLAALKLSERTRRGSANWASSDEANTFVWSGLSSAVSIAQYRTVNATRVRMAVVNEMGDEIDSITVDHRSEDYEALERLFELARRSALNVDSVLDNLLNELG